MSENTPETPAASGGLAADLVLEGGGVKGIALVGALTVLEEHGYRFNRVAGTSAGAIVGALVAAGLSAGELETLMRGLDYNRFRDGGFLDRLGRVGQGVTLLTKDGIYRGDYLRRWLGEALAAHGVRTFADLRLYDGHSTLPPEQQYRLTVMTSDVSEHRLARLPWDYPAYGLVADRTPVVDAVRASMSIPFFFRPVKMRRTETRTETWLVDGGMLSNFPVDVFDRTDGRLPRWPTFGLKLSAREKCLGGGVDQPIQGVLGMTKAMLATMSGFYDRMHLDDPAVVDRTIFIDTFDIKSTDFGLDRDAQQRLFASGQDAAHRFLETWDFTAYCAKHRAPAVPAQPTAGSPEPAPASPPTA